MNLDSGLLQRARQALPLLALAIGAGAAGGVLAAWQARMLSQVIGAVFLRGATLSQVAGPVLFLLVLIAIRFGLTWGSETGAGLLAITIKTRLRQELFEHLVILGPAFQDTGSLSGETSQTGEIVNVLTEGLEALDAYYSQYLPQLALAGSIPLIYLLFIFPLDPLSGVILLITAPLIPLFMILIGSAAQVLTRRRWLALSRMSAYFLEVIQGLPALKLLGYSREQAANVQQASETFRRTTMDVLRVTFLSALVLEILSTLSVAIVAVEIGLRLLYGRLGFEQALFVLILAPEFYLPLRMLGTRFHAGMAGTTAARRIFALLEKTGPAEKQPAAVYNPDGIRLLPLVFQEVSYRYEGSAGRPALEHISFCIQPGEKIALVGPSGAGKSTLAALLLRFIAPSAGVIQAGNVDLQAIPPDIWRQQIAWVPQRPYLFYGTLLDNIRLARPQADLPAVLQAARLAGVEGGSGGFVETLAQGYQTLIGERGTGLSSGQAQRIALARAFLQTPHLLILDEPTANLDIDNENLIVQALQNLPSECSVLVIAHRLNTVKACDRVMVLQSGSMVETGTAQELLNQDGLFVRLVGGASS